MTNTMRLALMIEEEASTTETLSRHRTYTWKRMVIMHKITVVVTLIIIMTGRMSSHTSPITVSLISITAVGNLTDTDIAVG